MGTVSGEALSQPQAILGPSVEVSPNTVDFATQGGPRASVGPTPTDAAATGPRVAVARRIIDAAGAFDGYMRRAGSIKADFSSGGAVARAVELGAVYEPEQFEQGAIADAGPAAR